jgi:hypothetical protein
MRLLLLLGCVALAGAAPAPPEVAALARHAAGSAQLEYAGSVRRGSAVFDLFVLFGPPLSGVFLVRREKFSPPIVVLADTSLFPPPTDDPFQIDLEVWQACEVLLRRANGRRFGVEASRSREISEIGDGIDRIIGSIAGYTLGTNSTRAILRALQSASVPVMEARSAPPGTIVVSPTRVDKTGRICLGHAGIVGHHGKIYSTAADSRGGWRSSFTIQTWIDRFSNSNGVYAFLLTTRQRPAPAQSESRVPTQPGSGAAKR